MNIAKNNNLKPNNLQPSYITNDVDYSPTDSDKLNRNNKEFSNTKYKDDSRYRQR